MRPTTPVPVLRRRARLLARRCSMPLHAALDRVAREEGFARWSLLAERSPGALPPLALSALPALLPRLAEGDLLLLGARPGQGKTLLGLRLLLEAARAGRGAVFFTLEETERGARSRLARLCADRPVADERIGIVASDDVCAATIAAHLSGASRGTVAVIDYLQILDQRRSRPPLQDQVETLRDLAFDGGFVIAILSQIDRRFDPDRAGPPDIADVRLPNPLALTAFSKACFLHAGEMRFLDSVRELPEAGRMGW